ncbi:hypothetical protein LWI29_033128 [Acer saccharum]|uniref:Uncharacterized protein n=1 Tax=Acer saccharum TaxID=4024 RepID=A0AA39T7C1_ACESA|nr:hypothetical protein LWI29_033128 [Acer saccharum]
MSNQSDDSSNLSLEKMINDYKGDSSEVDLDQSDTTSGSSDHDEVSIAGPPTDVGVGEDVKNLKFKLGIPDSVRLRAFKIGLRFPIPSLARQLLNFFDIAPS